MPTRALVLGGGGSAGNAWLVGVLAGLAQGGVDPARADLIVGTSAGATAAVQIASTRPDVLFAQVSAEAYPPRPATPAGPPLGRQGGGFMQLTSEIIASSSDLVDMRRRLGAAALAPEFDRGAEAIAGRLAQVASRLPTLEWPERRVVITAVDAVTGDEVLFDSDSGVTLADAVAASTSVGFGIPPHAIGDRRFLDGGYRANENADVAEGYDHVLVLSPLGGRSRHPVEWGTRLDAQADRLRAKGSEVQTILPDEASREAFGENLMDLSRRPGSARAGAAQGLAAADALRAFWA